MAEASVEDLWRKGAGPRCGACRGWSLPQFGRSTGAAPRELHSEAERRLTLVLPVLCRLKYLRGTQTDKEPSADDMVSDPTGLPAEARSG